ncbi:unnamed protein product [Diatraea saccharalis]|uniref:Uncharacterized protein n=1 Tax=Diatraea saccharalis TaxID=40085 RepID=A0A9N9WF98_9NEOP|nr:unnamed protein product [Diatraea saccharalis]
MQAMSANASAPRAPQRSPFAIQELLGLSDNRESRERYFESRDDRVLNLSERERSYAPQFPLPASVASRVAYAAAFNAQAAVAAAFLPGPPLLHPPPASMVANFNVDCSGKVMWVTVGTVSTGLECGKLDSTLTLLLATNPG